MPYLLLAVSVLCAVAGDAMLKLSNGFSKKQFIAGIAAAYLLAIYLQSVVLEWLPLGFVYAVWNALQIALVSAVGAHAFKEGWNKEKGIGIAVIVLGVFMLNLGKGV